MKFCVNDFTIYYEKYGNSNKYILILPGWGETRNTFKYLIDVLKNEYTVYILDYPGFGNSLFPSRDLTLEDYTDLISDFIKTVINNDVVIIAHSFGGRIVINLFKKKIDLPIKNLILIDIAGIKPKKSLQTKIKEKTYKILKKLKVIFPNKIRKKYLEFLIKIFGSTDYINLSSNIRNTFISIVNNDQRYDIKYIDVNTLIIWGENDLDVPLQDAYFINQEIKNSGLVIIPKSGHFPYLDKIYYVNRIILEYLNGEN